MAVHLTKDQRRQIRRLSKDGMRTAEVARQIGCNLTTVMYHRRRRERPDPMTWSLPKGFTLKDREQIAVGIARRETLSDIAGRVGFCVSSVSKEVNKNGGRRHYRAVDAHKRAFAQARRPKPCRIEDNPRLRKEVVKGLEHWWSPDQVSRRLRIDFPDDPMMKVSHETIYKSIYVQGRGQLKAEILRCLRTGRTERKPRSGVPETRGRIPDMVMISERPPEVDKRRVPGHWEGDLIIGEDHASAIGTLVERTTGYLLLLHLPDGYQAEKVDAAMRDAAQRLPKEFMKTVTWDQGKEMSRHASFSVDTNIDVYFCDPHSPWQRGTNENMNGLLRQYFPKGTDLSVHSQDRLREVELSLNDRPRRRFGYMKPLELFAGLFSSTG